MPPILNHGRPEPLRAGRSFVSTCSACLVALSLAHCQSADSNPRSDVSGHDPVPDCAPSSLVADAVPAIRAKLLDTGTRRSGAVSDVSQDDAVLTAVQRLHLPGLLTLLAVGQRDAAAAGSATGEPLLAPISWKTVQETIRTKYEQAVKEKVQDAVADHVVTIPGLSVSGVSARELEQAATLLRSGQFESDVRDVVATVLDAGFDLVRMDGGTLLGSVVRRGPHALSREWLCLEGLGRPGCMWHEWPAVAKSLLRTGTVGEHVLYRDTLDVLAGSTVGATLFTTVGRLLQNDTVRLALVLYARTQGVVISDAQLQQVGSFFQSNTEASRNLTTLIEPALLVLTERYHGDQIRALLERLANRRVDATCRAAL